MRKQMIEGYVDWKIFEDDITGKFKKHATPYMTFSPSSEIEWLVHAQHHGLPTRLLDWTSNPLKALFFAVEDVSSSDRGAVWGLDTTSYYDDLENMNEKGEKVNTLKVYLPDSINARIIAQESCFTIFPRQVGKREMPALTEKSRYRSDIIRIQKFLVPTKKKAEIRRELEILGVTHKSLFPDLDGLATSIRRTFDLA